MSDAAEAIHRVYCEHKCRAARAAGITVRPEHEPNTNRYRFVWRFPTGNLLAGHYKDTRKAALFSACGMLP